MRGRSGVLLGGFTRWPGFVSRNMVLNPFCGRAFDAAAPRSGVLLPQRMILVVAKERNGVRVDLVASDPSLLCLAGLWQGRVA
jgi:hypothetical protein